MPGQTLPAITISVAIDRDWRRLYEAFWQPEAFPKWASGLSDASLRAEGGKWLADGPDGPIEIVFTGHNDFGVMDHRVRMGGGDEVDNPLRIIPNGRGALVSFTLFRRPGMSDDKFAADADWVRRDLARLKEIAEREV